MKKNLLSIVAVAYIITIVGCTTPSKNTPETTPSMVPQVVATEQPNTTPTIEATELPTTEVKKEEHLDYTKQNEWDFESGDSQSPIDIVTEKAEPMKDSGKLEFSYSNLLLDIDDNGHSIQADTTGSAIIDGRTFNLAQLHFHSPSEHTIDGKSFAAEGHFVNKQQDGRIAVIGVLFEEGDKNETFQEILDNIIVNEKNEKKLEINISSIIPENKSYYHYLGSLTTPPLSENVEWYVLKNTIKISKEQIEEFQTHYKGNNRKIQELNNRAILEHSEK